MNSSQCTEFRYASLVYLWKWVIIEKYRFMTERVRMVIQECEIKSMSLTIDMIGMLI